MFNHSSGKQPKMSSKPAPAYKSSQLASLLKKPLSPVESDASAENEVRHSLSPRRNTKQTQAEHREEQSATGPSQAPNKGQKSRIQAEQHQVDDLENKSIGIAAAEDVLRDISTRLKKFKAGNTETQIEEKLRALRVLFGVPEETVIISWLKKGSFEQAIAEVSKNFVQKMENSSN